MAKIKQKKQKLAERPDPSVAESSKKLQKKKKTRSRKLKSKSKPVISSSSDSEIEVKPESIQKLLDPFSKEQLIDLAIDSALLNPTLSAKIKGAADSDVSHRKIFVHGLPWSTTDETLAAEFSQYGEIENCNLVIDKVTGKAKGYAFIIFKSRKSAFKSVKQPKKVIDNRVVCCQFASMGPPSSSVQQEANVYVNTSARKIYVNNVWGDVNTERLKNFFASFGEIESGPTGFDPNTGKLKGYALFVYRTVEGAKKALEEPTKVFEGRQLHCQKALEGKKFGGGVAGITTSVQPVPPAYAALAGGQNMGLTTAHNPNMAGGQNMGLTAHNPNLAGGQNMRLTPQNPNVVGSQNMGLTVHNHNLAGSHNMGLTAQNPNLAGSQNMGLAAQNPNLAGSQNMGLAAQNQNMGWMAHNPNLAGGLMVQNSNANVLNALYASLYGNPNAAAGLVNVNPYGGYGQFAAGGIPMGLGIGGYSGILGNYGLGAFGRASTIPGVAGSAGSSSNQPLMHGFSNAYPNAFNDQKTSSAGTPAFSGQPPRQWPLPATSTFVAIET